MLPKTEFKEVEMAAAASTTMAINVSPDGMDTLSAELRDRLGVEEGSEIILHGSDDGVHLMTKKQYVNWLLDRIGEGLPDDVTLEELIESGRELREELIFEHYGLRPEDVER